MRKISIILVGILLAIMPAVVMAENMSTNLTAAANQYWKVSSPILNITGDMTLEACYEVKTPPANGNYYAILAKDNLTERSYGLFYAQLGGVYKIMLYLFDTSSYAEIVWNRTLTPGNKYRISVSIDISEPTANKAKLLLNGVDQGSPNNANGVCASIKSGSAPFEIGARNGALCSDAYIDDVRLWNIARTSAEISGDWQSELNGNEPGLVAYWKFNNNGLDSTANGSNLTGINSPVFSTNAIALTEVNTTAPPASSCPFTTTFLGSDSDGDTSVTIGLVEQIPIVCVSDENGFVASLNFFDANWSLPSKIPFRLEKRIKPGGTIPEYVIIVMAYSKIDGRPWVQGKFIDGTIYCDRVAQ